MENTLNWLNQRTVLFASAAFVVLVHILPVHFPIFISVFPAFVPPGQPFSEKVPRTLLVVTLLITGLAVLMGRFHFCSNWC